MVIFFTLIVVLVVGYALVREGLFTSLLMLINVILAGIVAFNFWEPVANWLDNSFQGGALAGFEDAFALGLLFAVALGILRVITNNLADTVLDFSAKVNQIGGGVLGLATGYLLAGFLMCVLETLPWHENFMDFEPRLAGDSSFRSYLPPNRVWLAMMRHAGAFPLAWKSIPGKEEASSYDRYKTFDREATFELRYQRYRRYGEGHGPLQHSGELDRALHK